MPNVLIVFGTTNGHTAEVAARIGAVLEGEGATVRLCDAAAADLVRPADHDAVIVGASVHMGLHQPAVTRWVRRHAATLNRLPSAFFSVSLTAATDSDQARATAREFIDDFVEDTGWAPRRSASFAGALKYSQYDLKTRMFLRVMMARHGHQTDTSRDYVYTDWAAVEAFAHGCLPMLPVASGAAA